MAIIVLITGANTGIGFHIVRALSSSSIPYHILVGARSPAKATDAIKAVQEEFPSSESTYAPVIIDIEHDESIQSAFAEISSAHGKLDVLINNAGAQLEPQLTRGEILTERELWNKSWNVNTASTQVMTSTFTPLLLKSSNPRLLFITSGTSTLTGIETQQSLRINHAAPPGWPKPASATAIRAYRSSKTGLNMLMREWHRILKNDGVKVFGISPGYLATGLGGDEEFNKRMGAGDPAVAGPFVRSVLEGERDEDVGKVLTRAGVQEW
ncbi:putative short chain dehydrogenase [Aspergillus undulatus]|uniref:putative short chain dehydrogenase n=1 Tax=Aspergillus undulatus TaxID=1810928 RepID=UPI003CCC9083